MTRDQISAACLCVTHGEALEFLSRVLELIHGDGPAAATRGEVLIAVADAMPPAIDQYTGWKREDPCARCGRAEADRVHRFAGDGHGFAHTYHAPRPVAP